MFLKNVRFILWSEPLACYTVEYILKRGVSLLRRSDTTGELTSRRLVTENNH